MCCCVHTGEAAALFVQKWFQTGGPLDVLDKILVLDEYNALTPDLQPWFRESREPMFGCTLEEVQIRHSLWMPPLCGICLWMTYCQSPARHALPELSKLSVNDI